MHSKTILVAPLHWGLGHATRCIPIIRKLLDQNFNVLLASDGAALQLLRSEFPMLPNIELPSYNITYPKNGALFKWEMLFKLPQIQRSITLENKIIEDLVADEKIDGIISDNRYGVRNKKIPSVFITHQLNVLSGKTTFFSSLIQRYQIKKFDACWIPDVEGTPNLSGRLGHPKKTLATTTYIGPLSRMKKQNRTIKYDILVLLSGPEPQRSFLESTLIEELKYKNQKILLIQGVIADQQEWKQLDSITIVNFMESSQLENSINESNLVISRSGYTTIMDLTAMEKKAFLIPTPGQYEQEYLANRLKELGIAPSCRQSQFTIEKLAEIEKYKGFTAFDHNFDFQNLFRFFESKGKL
jgi:uncharacterized protein (TIGR00661 family)